MRAAKAQSRTTNEFQLSNSTTHAFIGGTQKAWMTGQSANSVRDASAPKKSRPTATNQALTSSHGAESVPEMHKVVEDSVLSNTAFGPNFDRGRYPAQRPRHGATNRHASSSSNPLAATGLTPLAVSMPAREENHCIPPVDTMDASTNAMNVLPSPSPSVEARAKSVNATETDDNGHQPQALQAQPVETPAPTLEELVKRCGGMDQIEKLLKDAGKSDYGPSQMAASAIAQGLSIVSPSSDPGRPRRSDGAKDQPMPEASHDIPIPTIAQKRSQEVADEPRKRVQSLSSSFSEGNIASPSATAVLPSQNGLSSAAASPSRIEIHSFAQVVVQRMQLIASTPDREGGHVEQSRLGLLRQACEHADLFYLVLHQLFCFDHQARKSHRAVPGLQEVHRRGLGVVAFLLVSNDQLVDDAVTWFSGFPSDRGESLINHPEFKLAWLNVLNCLENLANSWGTMRSRCSKRKYPPLVDELIVSFKIESFLFQQIIFRAILRDIWSGKQDKCFQLTEDSFNKDYDAVMRRNSSGSNTVDLVDFHQQAVIKHYVQLLNSHWQHKTAGPTVSMAAPVEQQTQSRIVPANHASNSRKKSQPGHDKNIQASLMVELHKAMRHKTSAAPGPASTNIQAIQGFRPGNLSSQSQALASNPCPSPQANSFTQSPTTLQSFFSPGGPTNAPGQWNNPQQQWERRGSSTAGNLRNGPDSMTPVQQTPHVLPSNVPGNPQFQSHTSPQQQSHNRVPSSSTANPHPRLQSEFRRSISNRASETTMPTLSPHPSIQPSPSLPVLENSLPFTRLYPPLQAHPNPTTSALHQAHLRSPTLSYFDPSKISSSMPKCYRFIKHVLMPPEELDSTNRHVNWDFSVNREITDLFARDTPSSDGAPPLRAIMPGSRLCRVRCVNLKGFPGMPSQSEWAAADNVWPGSTAVVLNGTALDIRKKSHHGRDLPIDVTRYIKAGHNNLSTAVIGFQTDGNSRYAIGVEFIQVMDEQQIKSAIKTLPWSEARQRILDQSKNVDPDIEVIQSHKVLDLTDPFTARIFKVPVRGINCQHNQCFDRDTFLQTRTGKVVGEPCDPDQFRCPICGNDCRPESMVMDTFFMSVRMTLKERHRLDAKAIILQDSGEWEIKEEEEATGESGDGTGRRKAGVSGVRTAGGSRARQSVPPCEVIEFIDLDDD